MFRCVLLFCSFSLLRLSSSLVHNGLQLDHAQANGRSAMGPYLSELERDHTPLPMDSAEDRLLMDVAPYDDDSAVMAAVQLQGRAMRSPRRCIPHQQSCLGYPLPCCDLCDTCYCRFFNAICYCRRVGHTCPPRRT